MVLSIYKVRIANAINQQFGILAVLFVVLSKEGENGVVTVDSVLGSF